MQKTVLTLAVIAVGIPSSALAGEVTRSVDVNAGAAEVWSAVGGFCGIADWHPAIATCAEETIDGSTHRRLTTGDGGVFLEKRLATDEAGKSYTYSIVEGPLPITGYAATFSVEDAGDGARVVWTSRFKPDGVSGDEAAGIVAGIYDAGLAAIAARFAN